MTRPPESQPDPHTDQVEGAPVTPHAGTAPPDPDVEETRVAEEKVQESETRSHGEISDSGTWIPGPGQSPAPVAPAPQAAPPEVPVLRWATTSDSRESASARLALNLPVRAKKPSRSPDEAATPHAEAPAPPPIAAADPVLPHAEPLPVPEEVPLAAGPEPPQPEPSPLAEVMLPRDAPTIATVPSTVTPPVDNDVPLAVGEVKLVIEQGMSIGKEFLVGDEEMLVGRRDPEQDFLPDIDLFDQESANNRYISRRQVCLFFAEGGLWVEDLESSNGTAINNRTINAHEPHRLKPGDKLLLAQSVLIRVRQV